MRPRFGEDQDVGVRRGDEQVGDEVLVPRLHPDAPAPPALLRAVGGDRGALDVAGVRDRDRHVLVGDQVLDRDLVGGAHDLGAARVAVGLADLRELGRDDLVDARGLAARMSLRSAMRTTSSASSSWIFWRSRPVSRCSCSSRISSAWISLSAKREIEALPARSPACAPRGSARSPRRGGRARSRSPRGRGRAPRPCAARTRCAGAPPRAGSRRTARRRRAGSAPAAAGRRSPA